MTSRQFLVVFPISKIHPSQYLCLLQYFLIVFAAFLASESPIFPVTPPP
nr:MAG TPA: hypothetical protein [Caudoviricetes sp.]